jgi:hypothetical protein
LRYFQLLDQEPEKPAQGIAKWQSKYQFPANRQPDQDAAGAV